MPLQASEATPNIGYAPLSLRHRLKELTQCTIHGFGLLKRRQMATIRNDLKPGVRNQAMRSLGYADWQQAIIFAVQDQRWDGNLGQPIDIVGPKAAPPDLATLQLPGSQPLRGAYAQGSSHRQSASALRIPVGAALPSIAPSASNAGCI